MLTNLYLVFGFIYFPLSNTKEIFSKHLTFSLTVECDIAWPFMLCTMHLLRVEIFIISIVILSKFCFVRYGNLGLPHRDYQD